MRTHLNLSVDSNLLLEAKRRKINISEITEEAIARNIRQIAMIDDLEYPIELAETNPEEYWINPQGKCKRRGQPQYFIQDNGKDYEVSKEKYLLWWQFYVKNLKKLKGRPKTTSNDNLYSPPPQSI